VNQKKIVRSAIKVATEPSPLDIGLARRRIAAFTFGGGAQLLAIILLLTTWEIYQGRLNAYQAAEVATTNLSHTLGANFASTIEKIDLGLLSIQDELSRQQKREISDDQQIKDTIARQDTRNPDSAGFRVYGPDGRLLFGRANIAEDKANVSELEPFKFLQDHSAVGLFVSPPIFGTVIQQWIVSASRRINNTDGSFGGVVASGISTQTLVKAFSALNLGPGGIVALYHTDDHLAARFPIPPGSEDPIGKVVINDELRSVIANGVHEAQIDYNAAVDRVSRTGHALKVPGQPYYILVAFAETDYLAGWRSQSLKLIAFAGTIVGLLLLAMRIYYRAQIRRLQLIVDLAESNRQLLVLSATDGLTGIANRRRFDETIEKEWRRGTRSGQPLALAMVDVDFFKNFNDNYGHQSGDECLRAVAQILEQHAHRAGDLVARYGGEEFALLGAGTGSASAKKLAEAIRTSLEQLAMPHAVSPFGRVTVSIGVASVTPTENDGPDSLIRMADEALYAAKTQGRNCVVSAVTNT
jgi:diguanylate cyclase (GGDEF)-like protein